MKVPKSYEGKLVCVQLGTPVYAFECAGRARIDGAEQPIASPIMKSVQTPEGVKQSQIMTNLLVGAQVKEVTEDGVLFALFDPAAPDGVLGTVTHKLVPSALIISLDLVAETGVAMPVITQGAPSREPPRILQP